MNGGSRVLAVDLGAASIRVAAIDLDAPAPEVHVVHRWSHGPVTAPDGSLRWDWPGIVAAVENGLNMALDFGPVASIGVDGWGVDYGLIDSGGELISLPYSYRDHRTGTWWAVAERIGSRRLYDITGVQLMGINTIFQVAAHNPADLRRASRLLLLPDLLIRHLTRFEGAERSNASTTGLMDGRTADWSDRLVAGVGVQRSLFPEIVLAGERVGAWRKVPVHLVGSHDTASAFLGMPGGMLPGTVFVSTGTWIIVGVERCNIDISPPAYEANFSNEAGALGGFRFLRNVAGFWIIEQCRKEWGNPPLEDLFHEAASTTDEVPVFDASDERFLTPPNMNREIRRATGMSDRMPRGTVVRSVLESIVADIASVIEELAQVAGLEMNQLALVGGGSRSPLLRQLLGARTGLPVMVGSPEATALGNAVAQGIALGVFRDIADARTWVDSGSRS